MGLGDLLIPALGGYLFLTICYATKYTIEDHSGYQVLLQSISCGIGLFIISHLIINFMVPEKRLLRITSIFPEGISPATALSFVLGLCFAYFLNLFYHKKKAWARYAKVNNIHIYEIIHNATNKRLPIHITLDDGKIYIGEPLATFIRRRENEEIAIVPWISGHRDKDTGKMKIDIDYIPVIIESMNDDKNSINYQDYRLIVPLSRVISSRLFSLDVYNRFFNESQDDS